MFPFLIFIISFLVLLVIFFRRYNLTKKDIELQVELQKATIVEKEAEAKIASESEIQTEAEATTDQKEVQKQIKIADLFSQAEQSIQAGKLLEAKKLLTHLLSLDAHNLEAQKKLGCLYIKEGEDKKAEQIFNKILQTNKDAVCYSNLGLALFNQKKFTEAAAAYEQATQLDDSRSARFASLGHVYHELGQDAKALKNFEEAVKREPKNIEYLFILVDYYQKRNDPLKLRATLDRILDVEPFNEEAKKKLAELGIAT